MSLKPSDPYYGEFTTASFTTGAATTADSMPTATATKNGADDGTFALAVALLDTGRYKITGTVPAGYAKGDQVQVSVSAIVGGVTGKGVIDGFVIDSKRVGDLNDAAAAPSVSSIRTEMDTNSTKLANLDATVSSRMASATFPANFAALGITVGGKISEVALVDALTTYTGNTPQTGDAFARLGVAGVGLTNLGDTRIAKLDATVSSRSTYAGGTVAGVTAPVTLDLTQAVPLSNTANTLGDCFNASRADGFGKWTKVGAVLTLFAADGTTPVRVFTLDDSTNPTSRS
jgi:hypothetical protein